MTMMTNRSQSAKQSRRVLLFDRSRSDCWHLSFRPPTPPKRAKKPVSISLLAAPSTSSTAEAPLRCIPAPDTNCLSSTRFTPHKIEVDQNSSANKQRVELLTHALPGEKPTADEASVSIMTLRFPAGRLRECKHQFCADHR